MLHGLATVKSAQTIKWLKYIKVATSTGRERLVVIPVVEFIFIEVGHPQSKSGEMD